MTSTHKLEITLPSETEILLTRKFDATRDLVYRCFADGSTHKHWVGCGFGNVTESYGKPEISEPWSFKMDMDEQGNFHCFGQCLEAVPGERFVRTFIFNVPDIREWAAVECATFEEENGVTTVNIVVRHLNKTARDGHYESGMEQGAAGSYDALDRYLAEQTS